MNERIKELRLKLNLNQEEFGEKVNISRSHVASLERGSRNVTERTLSDISREFNVNEEWLRIGEGEMFIQKDSTIVSKLSEEYNLDSLDIEIVKCYLELDPEQRNAIKSYVSSVAKAITYENDEVTATTDDGEDDIDKELEAYRLELEAEAKGKTLSASDITKEENKNIG